jgi:hypothetical protein
MDKGRKKWGRSTSSSVGLNDKKNRKREVISAGHKLKQGWQSTKTRNACAQVLAKKKVCIRPAD